MDPQHPHEARPSEALLGGIMVGSGFLKPHLAAKVPWRGSWAGRLTSGQGFLSFHPQEQLQAPLPQWLAAAEKASQRGPGAPVCLCRSLTWLLPGNKPSSLQGARRNTEGRKGAAQRPHLTDNARGWPSTGDRDPPRPPPGRLSQPQPSALSRVCLRALLLVPRLRTRVQTQQGSCPDAARVLPRRCGVRGKASGRCL